MSVVIINDSTINTGLGRYAADLSRATNNGLLSLNLDSSIDPSKYPGEIISYKRFMKISNGWYFSHRFPAIFLSNIKRQIRNKVNPSTILHYSSQVVPFLNLKNRYIYTVHDLFGLDKRFNQNPRLKSILEANLKHIKGSERIITVSKYVKSLLQRYGMHDRIDVIYPPISSIFMPLENRFSLRRLLHLPEDKKLILSVSSQDPRKNLKAVIDTMQYLGDEYRLVRIGHPVGNCLSFNNVDDQQLNMIYNACDVLLFPSLDEGFGYPLVEAMGVGLPVVASDIPVFHEIAGNFAVLVDANPKKLAVAVKEAIENSYLYRQRGLELAKRYSYDHFRQCITDFLKQFEE